MISRLLVANRGEIARRVFRTCRDLGVGTVAVYADADTDAVHAGEADLAVRLPGAAPGETYLRADLLVDAAVVAGADAVHPGYGFLSEQASFASAVLAAGLTWVGPPPAAIEAMGSKVAAKRLMAGAGVPVLAELDPDQITAADLPVLVKASAGGGGRGMRIVRSLDELPAAVSSARAEAESAFGDATVFCERYLEAGRHIEVQILADRHGTVWALGERECSIQRRHQKVIEEAPSPAVDADLRARLCDAAVAAAKAVGYVGAGTVEFLLDPVSGGSQGAGVPHGFAFLEMNTRLQVEHPVTECVTGLDLVALQLAVAEGERLAGAPPEPRGYAVEARLYAETVEVGPDGAVWRPRGGVLHRFEVPGVDVEFAVPPAVPAGGQGLRLDSGVVSGSTVGVHYDPMLAKLIAWAPTRRQAVRRLATALAGARVHGVETNRDLLVRTLRHPAFLAGHTDTAFFDRHDLGSLAAPLADGAAESLSALAAALADAASNRADMRVLGGLPSGWRNVPSQPQRKAFDGRAGRIDVEYRLTRDGLTDWRNVTFRQTYWRNITLRQVSPDVVVLDVDGVRRAFRVGRYQGLVCVDSELGGVALRPVDRFPDPADAVAAGSLPAPLPGAVVALLVAEGDTVSAGQTLFVLDAMKMRHPVVAPAAGVVTSIAVAAGAQVEAGTVLAVVDADGCT